MKCKSSYFKFQTSICKLCSDAKINEKSRREKDINNKPKARVLKWKMVVYVTSVEGLKCNWK